MEMYADGKGYRGEDEAMCLGFYKSISHIKVSGIGAIYQNRLQGLYTEDTCVWSGI